MVGLVKQHRAVPPCALLVAPVVEFRSDNRININPVLELRSMSTGFANWLMAVVRLLIITFPIGRMEDTALTFYKRQAWNAVTRQRAVRHDKGKILACKARMFTA